MKNKPLRAIGGLAVFSCLVILQACGEIDQPASADVHVYAPEMVTIGGVTPTTADEAAQTGRAVSEAMGSMRLTMADHPSWESANDAVRGLLNKERNSTAQRVWVQVASDAMLRTHLLRGSNDASKATAAAWYLDALVSAGSPNTPLVEETLQAYGDAMSSDMVLSVSREAVANADAHLARSADCDACTSTEIMESLSADAASQKEVEMLRIAQSAERLRE